MSRELFDREAMFDYYSSSYIQRFFEILDYLGHEKGVVSRGNLNVPTRSVSALQYSVWYCFSIVSFIKLDGLDHYRPRWLALSPALKSVRSPRCKIWAEPRDVA